MEDIILPKGNFINVIYDFSFASFWRDGVTRFWYIGLLIPLYIVYPLVYKLFDTEKKTAFCRLVTMIIGSVLLITIVWILGRGIYENIEIALWRIPIFLSGAYMGERLYAGDEFNRGDGIVCVIGIILKFMACVCTFGMMVGKYTLPNIFRSRLAVSVVAIALVYVVVMLLEKMKWDKLKRFFSYAGGLSLELYISHIAVRAIARLIGLPIYNIAFYCCCMAAAVILGILLKEVSGSLQKMFNGGA